MINYADQNKITYRIINMQYHKLFLNIGICILSVLSVNTLMASTKTNIYLYKYNENGNTIAVDEIKNNQATRIYEYDYNGLNQMVGFTNVQNNEYYGYDYYPNGKRSSKYTSSQTGTESIEFLYGHNGNLLNAEYSQNSQLQKRSSYFAGIRFVDDLINSNDSIFQLPLADRHNHPATISFSQGQSQIQSYHLTDYGQLSQSNTNNNTNGNVSNNGPLIDFSLNPKVYGSGYYDPESKLQYMGARYYSADSHRFMAQDSYNLLNRYNYANANPVMNYDPDGHKSMGDFLKDSSYYFLPANKNEKIFKSVAVGIGLVMAIGMLNLETNIPLVLAEQQIFEQGQEMEVFAGLAMNELEPGELVLTDYEEELSDTELSIESDRREQIVSDNDQQVMNYDSEGDDITLNTDTAPHNLETDLDNRFNELINRRRGDFIEDSSYIDPFREGHNNFDRILGRDTENIIGMNENNIFRENERFEIIPFREGHNNFDRILGRDTENIIGMNENNIFRENERFEIIPFREGHNNFNRILERDTENIYNTNSPFDRMRGNISRVGEYDFLSRY